MGQKQQGGPILDIFLGRNNRKQKWQFNIPGDRKGLSFG